AAVAGQPAQRVDQLLQVVGEVLGQRLGDRRSVLPVRGDDEVDLVVGRVLKIILVIVVVVVVIVVIFFVVVIVVEVVVVKIIGIGQVLVRTPSIDPRAGPPPPMRVCSEG